MMVLLSLLLWNRRRNGRSRDLLMLLLLRLLVRRGRRRGVLLRLLGAGRSGELLLLWLLLWNGGRVDARRAWGGRGGPGDMRLGASSSHRALLRWLLSGDVAAARLALALFDALFGRLFGVVVLQLPEEKLHVRVLCVEYDLLFGDFVKRSKLLEVGKVGRGFAELEALL